MIHFFLSFQLLMIVAKGIIVKSPLLMIITVVPWLSMSSSLSST